MCKSRMLEEACVLSVIERQIVIAQIEETCRYRGWALYGAECRTNHFHVVVGASETSPEKVRKDLKTWCTRRLRERSEPHRENWWAERGSTRWIWDEESLDKVIQYVTEVQTRKGRDVPN